MHPAEHRAQLSRLRASEMISVVLTEFYRQLTKLTKVRLRRSRRGIAIAIPAQSSVSYGSFRACFPTCLQRLCQPQGRRGYRFHL